MSDDQPQYPHGHALHADLGEQKPLPRLVHVRECPLGPVLRVVHEGFAGVGTETAVVAPGCMRGCSSSKREPGDGWFSGRRLQNAEAVLSVLTNRLGS